MNDSSRAPQSRGRVIALVAIAAALTAVVVHTLQILLIGEGSVAVSGGAAGAVAAVAVAAGAFGRRRGD